MKESELREIAECALCGKPFGSAHSVMFYRVRIQSYIVDMAAVRRQSGLAMMLGNGVLASVMGPDEDMARCLNESEITVCASCSDKKEQNIQKLIVI